MKTLILSYSLTGHNEALAKVIAEALQAEHISITEPKKRTNGTIAADLIFGRTPRTAPSPQVMSAYDLVIFAAPVWMGQPAFPLRAYWKQLKKHPQSYAFVSVSGAHTPGLSGALKKKTGIDALMVVNLPITDLLPPEPKPTPQSIGAYRLTAQDMEHLTERALQLLREHVHEEV
ncbi:MAG: hypothetical protein WDA00_02240 [Eubacteriales bacterium]